MAQLTEKTAKTPQRSAHIRLLLAACGWPSGLVELAGWTKRWRLAEPLVVRIQPHGDTRPPIDKLGPIPSGLPNELVEKAVQVAGHRFVQYLLDFKPHVVGLRVEGWDIEGLRRLVDAVRLFSSAEVILGGPTATSHPIDVLRESAADYVFTGEAEAPLCRFLELAQRPNSRDQAADIPGLVYRHAGQIFQNAIPTDGYGLAPVAFNRPIASRDIIRANRPDWSLVRGFDDNFQGLFFTGGRGCPGQCMFCDRLHGPQLRTKTAGQLLEEIEAILIQSD